jgi:hypothetical protein
MAIVSGVVDGIIKRKTFISLIKFYLYANNNLAITISSPAPCIHLANEAASQPVTQSARSEGKAGQQQQKQINRIVHKLPFKII